MLILERLSENLNLLMKRARVTTNTLARQTNIPASTIKKLRNSSNTNPTLATLLPIASYFSISIENFIHNDLNTSLSTTTIKPKAYHLPKITWEESIQWPQNTRDISYTEIISEYHFSHLAFSLLMNHDTTSKFPINSLLLIEPTITPKHNDYVLVYKNGQSLPSLKLLLREDEFTWLKSLTIADNLAPLTEDYRILGVIIEYRYRLKN